MTVDEVYGNSQVRHTMAESQEDLATKLPPLINRPSKTTSRVTKLLLSELWTVA